MNYKKFFIAVVVMLIVGLVGFRVYDILKNKEIEIKYDDSNEKVDWTTLKEGDIDLNSLSGNLEINDSGTYTLTGSLNGSIIIEGEKDTLVKLILNGVDITSEDGPAIYVKKSENVHIYLNENTVNNLEDSSSYSDVDTDGDPNGTIFTKSDLIIDGNGILNVKSNYEDGIVSKDGLKILNGTINIESSDDGIRGKDYVVIKNGNISVTSGGDGIKSTNTTDSSLGYVLVENGNVDITAECDGIDAETSLIINNGNFNISTGGGSNNSSSSNSDWGFWGGMSSSTNTSSAKGLKSGVNITISNGIFILDTSDDAIHSNDKIEINGGSFNIASGDDGVHSDTTLILKDAEITITKSYEAIESSEITIESGNYDVFASDDGINVASGNDSSSMGRPGANNFSSGSGKLTINGGTIKVNATGDGIDINGSAYINGGIVYVDGPTDNGNGALDYDKEFVVKDATLIAAGSSGMMQSISSNSNVYTISVIFSSTQSENSKVTIQSDSENIISYTPSKKYSSIIISSPLLEKGKTYDIYVEDAKYKSVTINDIVNQVGNNQGGFNNIGGMKPGRR